MLKSSSNAQELRLSRPETTVPPSTVSSATSAMDTLKSSFLPNLAMDSGVITSASFCPMCGQQFERPQHAQEHMQLCHGISAGMIGGGSGIAGSGAGVGGLLLGGVPQPNVPVSDPMKIEYPCLSCEEKFCSAQELDEHHRIVHQTTAFLARCMACGIYGISSVTLHEGDEFKCMHCGSVCTASNMTSAQQPPYMDQPEPPQTPEEMPSIPPEEMNTIPPEELTSRQNQQQQRQQQQQQQQQQHQHQQQQQQQQAVQSQQQQRPQQQPDLLDRQRQPQPDLLDQQQQQQQAQQTQSQPQQQQLQQNQQQQQQQSTPLKVPPLTVKLNKGSNGNTEGHPHVIIKEEPLGISDGNGDIDQSSVPVYTIQQPVGATSVVVSTAAATAGALANETGTAAGSAAPTTTLNNKVRHKCPECPKNFKTPGTLAMHRKIHTGEADVTPKERPYTCSYCGKSFTQSNTLKQHTRIHTGEKPFRCGYCGRQFTVKDYLNKHLTTHTGEKPFHCVYCEKRFSVKDYLTKHIRTHTGEKPYTCPYCDKRFTQRSALTVHTTKLHPL
ncbi:chorion transcription factor Cf2 isoform X1 [Anastrepha ludens]|uniref:chorion transcription factor Cf2 isoform X1 n=2 Tax=Anastrepha ludens TaxID=28586 RepID=UPI0023AE6D9F|nr:chorion transcription factor Cf2 isoform X1 [Anastrepha ludens]